MNRENATVRKFRLSDTFIEPYTTAEVPWGPLGYVTFKRTYARRLSEFDAGAEGTDGKHQGAQPGGEAFV